VQNSSNTIQKRLIGLLVRKLLSFLRLLLFSFSEVLKGVTYKWALGLSDILKDIIQEWRVAFARRKLDHYSKNIMPVACAPIQHPSFHRPDPLIYSQRYLLSLGLAVTWDNPDIVLFRNGVIVSEGDLLPNTEYEIDATIWNNSFDAPIVGMTVDFAYLSFGSGTTLHAIGTQVINLGVKGGINHPAHARIPWTTPPAGHYCIQVDLKWVDDLNPANNMGQNNVNVVSVQSPATFSFQLRNKSRAQATYTFPTDMYVLPTLKDCEKKIRRRSNEEKWKGIQALHDRNSHPVPSDWTVTVTPNTVELNPDEEVPIDVSIDPPPSFTGTKAINIHTFQDNVTFIGGVTVYVSK
jgi:hypothetical protein